MKIMNFNINFKQGLRRVVLAFIGLCVIFAICCYIGAGCSFNKYRYVENVKIVNTQNNRTISLSDYIEEYLYNGTKYISDYDISCYPYKGYCEYEDWQYKRNKILVLTPIDEPKKEISLKIKAPSPLQYFCWQLWDFIKIFLIAVLSYGLYLLIEFVFCWIIKGFKE